MSGILRTAACGFAILLSASVAGAQSAAAPGSRELYDVIVHASGALFEAFDVCNLEQFAGYAADDLEFYHDRDGLITKQQVLEAVKNNICGKVRWELVSGSLEVYPIPNHGALETGVHRFYEVAPGKPDKLVGIAKYAHVWRQTTNGTWKVSRILSYDHKAAGAQ
jgi:hypothetical protein